VEAQQEESASRNDAGKRHLTREEAARLRERESLRLSVQNVKQQLERGDDRRRNMLMEALTDLERKMRDLES